MSTLNRLKSKFSSSSVQIDILDDNEAVGIPSFSEKLADIGLSPLKPVQLEILQINVGKMCNQECKHCHVDAGPDRKEIMTRETMEQCLEVMKKINVSTVDITGGAPEMNPDFRWFVKEIAKMEVNIIVRSNLTILLANQKYHDLPDFFREHRVNVVSSLPSFTALRTDAQRGEGVFEKSTKALQMLNQVGYARDPSLQLDLVYNPTGAFLPGSQQQLESEFKRKLKDRHGIDFNNLLVITNLPVSRFLDYLIRSGNYDDYMTELVNSFNPSAAFGVMCRNTLSVGWDGFLYDCDFNQMLDMKVEGASQHIADFDLQHLTSRSIRVSQHCYGCTAGAGSSCGGSLT